jgi:hypothetical protein
VCKGRGLIIHATPVDKAGGAADEDRPSGRSKRKRGGRSSGEPVEPPASEEQRKAASAAIAAIHKAAANEKDEDGQGAVEGLAVAEQVEDSVAAGVRQRGLVCSATARLGVRMVILPCRVGRGRGCGIGVRWGW